MKTSTVAPLASVETTMTSPAKGAPATITSTSNYSPGGESEWERMYKRLEVFQKAHGHCQVQDDAALLHWSKLTFA